MNELNSAKEFLTRISEFDSILPIRKIIMEVYCSGTIPSRLLLNIGGIILQFRVETINSLSKVRWDMLESIHSQNNTSTYFNVRLIPLQINSCKTK